MRILYVHHTLPPDSHAGSEIYHHRIAAAMAERHDVGILYREANAEQEEYAVSERAEGALRVFAINNSFKDCTSFELTYRNPGIEERVRRLLEALKPEIVHFGHVTCLSTGLPGLAREQGARVFMTLHDFWLLCQRGQLLRRDYALCDGPSTSGCALCLADQISLGAGTKRAAQIAGRYLRFAESPVLRRLASAYARTRLSLNRGARGAIDRRTERIRDLFDAVDRFISPSQFLRDFFVKSGLPSGKIVVSDNGLDKSFLASYKRVASDVLRLGYVGSIIPSKGLHVLLEAMEMLALDRVTLSIHGGFQSYHGDATYEPQIRSLLARLPKVHLDGPFEPSELGSVLSSIDVLVVPSIWYENSPLTIHEAFEAGIPVIAAELGGMREFVVHGKNGLLFKARSSDELASRIRMLLDDRSLLGALAAGAVPQKSLDANVRELETLYTEVLQK